MSMLSNNLGKLVYLGHEEKESKAGNKFTLVNVADSEEYQQHNFFKDDSCSVSDLKRGQAVEIELDLITNGYDQRLTLKKIKAL